MARNDNWARIIAQTKNFLKLDAEGEGLFINERPLNETNDIVVPNRIDLYTGLDLTVKDKIFVKKNIPAALMDTALLVNGDNYVCAFLQLKDYELDGERQLLLTADAANINFNNHSSTRYYFVFCDSSTKLYKVPIEVQLSETETTPTHLCIDFGTSNTTAGCHLDEHYVKNISNLAKINGNVKLNAENIVHFLNRTAVVERNASYTRIEKNCMAPTIVYVNSCENPDAIDYLFGCDAVKRIEAGGWCPKASCFMEIKRWTSDIDKPESIHDEAGNKLTVKRRDIVKAYLHYIIKAAENQFKCRFENVHISAPVKLKRKVLELYSSMLAELGYKLEIAHAIDEGIAVLFNLIHEKIKAKQFSSDQYGALIIDCGGGTSDLASCYYTIDRDADDIINLDIKTEYMNGDVNFGGNNLTYRIMQYMKVVYANGGERVNIDDLITQDTASIFAFIESGLESHDPNIKNPFDEIYGKLNAEYDRCEAIIPTKYKNYENKDTVSYERVKNNFYFLWEMADAMKREFYRTTSISRYTFAENAAVGNNDIDLHVKPIDRWRLSRVVNGELVEQPRPAITFTAKEIDKLLRADIYFIVRKFLNPLYEEGLRRYNQIKLSGQSTKINIFMEALKEFLPGKKISAPNRNVKMINNAEELKLLCLKGAIAYFNSLEQSYIEVNFENDIKHIPIELYIKNESGEEKIIFKAGDDWNQPAVRRRITSAGKEVYLYMRDGDGEIGEPYKYFYEGVTYKQSSIEEVEAASGGKINQNNLDGLAPNRKYIFVYLDKERWGFCIMPLYIDDFSNVYRGEIEFCSFEMDLLQETFFDGDK